MRLYGYYRSSTSYRVRIGLNLKGLAFETVSRMFRAFERNGYLRFLIDPRQRQIVILNAAGLTKLDAPRKRKDTFSVD